MKIAIYPFVKRPESYYYEFFSEGPNGSIKKADKDKVLATVAATVTDFMEGHPDAIIIVTGSTLSRTRLYQMGIAKILNEINKDFEIQGYINNSWHSFQKGVNYSAFLLKAR